MLFLVSFFIAGCASEGPEEQVITLVSPKGRRVEILAEIADSNEEITKGLSGRTELPEGRGMLFVFEKPKVLSFWMKDMQMPLDIIFFEEDGSFVLKKRWSYVTAIHAPSIAL